MCLTIFYAAGNRSPADVTNDTNKTVENGSNDSIPPKADFHQTIIQLKVKKLKISSTLYTHNYGIGKNEKFVSYSYDNRYYKNTKFSVFEFNNMSISLVQNNLPENNISDNGKLVLSQNQSHFDYNLLSKLRFHLLIGSVKSYSLSSLLTMKLDLEECDMNDNLATTTTTTIGDNVNRGESKAGAGFTGDRILIAGSKNTISSATVDGLKNKTTDFKKDVKENNINVIDVSFNTGFMISKELLNKNNSDSINSGIFQNSHLKSNFSSA